MTKKQWFMRNAALALYLLLPAIFSGCLPGASVFTVSPPPGDSRPVTLHFMVFSTDTYNTWQKLDLAGRFRQYTGNVTVEIEKVKDSDEFEKTLKIRKAARALPDVMPMKPYMLAYYQDVLSPLNDLKAAENSLYAGAFAIDGNIYGVPESSFNEFIWYRKSIFQQYHLSVPETWEEFLSVCRRIREGGQYIPVLMGGKDIWPDYPFNEFMPVLEDGDGKLWNKMAETDEPFSRDQPFYRACMKIQQFYRTKPFGDDPLGLGFDQVKMMFGARGAMLAAGAWFLTDARKALPDTRDLGTFFLPFRDKAGDPLKTITMVDGFYATPADGKHLRQARDLIEFLFSNALYEDYIRDLGLAPAQKNVRVAVDPVMQEAYDRERNAEFVVYDGGNSHFMKIAAEARFDVKKLGQEMLAGGDPEQLLRELNRSWKNARNHP